MKGTGCKAPSSPETEPDFYAMKYCHLNPIIPLRTTIPATTSQHGPSSDATIVSDSQCSGGESNKDDESTAMSDMTDAQFGGGSSSSNGSVQGVYTDGSPFNASREIFISCGAQTAAAANPNCVLIIPAGPLDPPGLLRNTVTQKKDGTTSVVKFIPMDLSERMKAREETRGKWLAPFKRGNANHLQEESVWKSSNNPAPTKALVGQPESSHNLHSEVWRLAESLPSFSAANDQGNAPTLADIIYMI